MDLCLLRALNERGPRATIAPTELATMAKRTLDPTRGHRLEEMLQLLARADDPVGVLDWINHRSHEHRIHEGADFDEMLQRADEQHEEWRAKHHVLTHLLSPADLDRAESIARLGTAVESERTGN